MTKGPAMLYRLGDQSTEQYPPDNEQSPFHRPIVADGSKEFIHVSEVGSTQPGSDIVVPFKWEDHF